MVYEALYQHSFSTKTDSCNGSIPENTTTNNSRPPLNIPPAIGVSAHAWSMGHTCTGSYGATPKFDRTFLTSV